MEKLEKILKTSNVRRFNNHGTPVALAVPQDKKIIYGLGGISDCEFDVANFTPYNAFFFDADKKERWTDEQYAESIRARAISNGRYIFQVYFLETNSHGKIIVPNPSGFHTYQDSEDTRKWLVSEGYKVKDFQENWQSKNVLQ